MCLSLERASQIGKVTTRAHLEQGNALPSQCIPLLNLLQIGLQETATAEVNHEIMAAYVQHQLRKQVIVRENITHEPFICSSNETRDVECIRPRKTAAGYCL